METKKIENMSARELFKRTNEIMSEPIPAELLDGLNEQALKKINIITSKAKELAELSPLVVVEKIGEISSKSTLWNLRLSITMHDVLKQADFDTEAEEGDTLTPLKEIFADADEVKFVIKSDKRMAVSVFVCDVWNIKE